MGIVSGRGGLRETPTLEYKNMAILSDITHADPQTRVHLRRDRVDHDGSVASTVEVRKHQLSPNPPTFLSVSYTHLTLPTIYSV